LPTERVIRYLHKAEHIDGFLGNDTGHNGDDRVAKNGVSKQRSKKVITEASLHNISAQRITTFLSSLLLLPAGS